MEQLHKLALFRLGEEMTEGGMMGNNKILCGGGKEGEQGRVARVPVTGHLVSEDAVTFQDMNAFPEAVWD